MNELPLKKIAFRPSPQFNITAVKHNIGRGFEEHFHESVEAIIVAKGSGRHLICGREYAASAGDVFVINPGVSHGFSKNDGLVLYNISYKEEMLSVMGCELQKLIGYQTLFVLGPSRPGEPFQCRLSLSLKDLEWATGLADSMIEEIDAGALGAEPLVRAYFMELVVGLSRIYEHTRKATDIRDGVELAAKLASHLERHFMEELSMEELARKSFVSGRHLRRVFLKYYHVSPMDYLMQLKIRHAALLLESENLRISEIAFQCGFCDGNYFARQFKRVVGISPRQYRLRLRHVRSPLPG